jgi:hypothetical protein
MADITVKKADGVTNITYTQLTPSAGDRVAAQWRENTATTAAYRPVVGMRTQNNGAKDGRRVLITGNFPYVDPVSGLVIAKMPLVFEGTVPLNVPDTFVSEGVAQFSNLLVSALIQASIKAGFAPT